MSLPKMGFVTVLGNILIVTFLVTMEFLFELNSYYFNLLGTSLIFLTLTVVVIAWARHKMNNGQDPQLMLLTGGMALIRIVVSLVWMNIVKDSVDVLAKSVVFEFIVIYIYYLAIDVYFLSSLLKNPK